LGEPKRSENEKCSSDFRGKLWIGLSLGVGIKFGLNLQTGMMIQEYVLYFLKIMVTV